jgi:hypothetical protein
MPHEYHWGLQVKSNRITKDEIEGVGCCGMKWYKQKVHLGLHAVPIRNQAYPFFWAQGCQKFRTAEHT